MVRSLRLECSATLTQRLCFLTGSFGAQPLPVFAQTVKEQFLSEQNPDKYYRIDYFAHLTESR